MKKKLSKMPVPEQVLSVGLENLRRQIRIVDAAQANAVKGLEYYRVSGDLKRLVKYTKEADLLDGLANFLSLLNAQLEQLPIGSTVLVYRGKEG
jgi:UV DNA damage repair endonuclease